MPGTFGSPELREHIHHMVEMSQLKPLQLLGVRYDSYPARSLGAVLAGEPFDDAFFSSERGNGLLS